jgi:ribosomal protein S12 methylthiotransferase
MAHQQVISRQRLAQRVGQTIDVLIDEVNEDVAVGRSYANAPEIDGNVFVRSDVKLAPGQLVRATVTESDEYDLWATLD